MPLSLKEAKMLHAAFGVMRMHLDGARSSFEVRVPLRDVLLILEQFLPGDGAKFDFTLAGDAVTVNMMVDDPSPARAPPTPAPVVEPGSSVGKLFDDLQHNLKAPWPRSRSLLDWIKGAQIEAHEAAIAAIYIDANNGALDVAEELGDVLWNLLSAMFVLEQSRGFGLAEISEIARAKLRARKPWAFDSSLPQPMTAEEEHRWTLKRKEEIKQEAEIMDKARGFKIR